MKKPMKRIRFTPRVSSYYW